MRPLACIKAPPFKMRISFNQNFHQPVPPVRTECSPARYAIWQHKPCQASFRKQKVCKPRVAEKLLSLARQNRTIASASDLRVDGAKSPEIPQKEGALGPEIANQNRKSLATFHRTLKSQCSIAFSCLGNRTISGVRDGHRNRKSPKNRCDFDALSCSVAIITQVTQHTTCTCCCHLSQPASI